MMAIHFSRSGCLWSIVLSIALTILLNVGLRACA